MPYLLGIEKSGYVIHIISCEKQVRLNKEKDTILKQLKNTNITWEYIIYDENGSFFSRFSYIKKITAIVKQLVATKKIELIHCRSYLSSLIGLKFKLKNNIPFLFDMRGFWADERIDGNIWSKRHVLQNLFYQYFKKKEIQFLKHSDAIVSLTLAGLNELEKKHPDLNIKQKTTIIPCCTNTSVFDKETSQSISLPNINANDHVIVYSGSIGTWYYTREMIDCILIWRRKIPNIKLLILTKDTFELNHIIESYTPEQKKIIVIASANYNQMPSYLSLAKSSIFFIKPAYSKIASSPTKMAECWAMNLPIITNQGIGDNDLYFNQHKGGILLNAFNEAEYNKACDYYVLLLKEQNDYRHLATEYFDTTIAIKRYITIYKHLTK